MTTREKEETQSVSLVVTSIAGPNQVLQTFASGCQERGYQFIVIGDVPSPADFQLDGCQFYSLAQQYETGFSFARLCPTRHYARKNIGYLLALRSGAGMILETDDDNIPYETFWNIPARQQHVKTVAKPGWANIYRYYSEENIWPRGLPLDEVKGELPDWAPLPQSFAANGSVALKQRTWCPFNSQNTWWWRDAFPLLYLPAYSSFRMTDIWRSFVAQRIAWANNWSVVFHQPTAWQERNEHNLMRDFRDEVPGYLHNKSIGEELDKLQLPSGVGHLGDNLQACYEKLVSMELIDRKELDLVAAWVNDLGN
jgi:hypothetical protein